MYQSPGRHKARSSDRQPQYGDFQRRNNPGPQRSQAPLLDPAFLASAIQVKNFKELLSAAESVENLSLALDMPLPRINELLRGENFPAAVAYHIEVTLDLPSGFLDRVNPRLTPEVIDRLKSPLSYKPTENEELPESQPVAAVVQPAEQLTLPVEALHPAATGSEGEFQQEEEAMAKTQSSKPAAKKAAAPKQSAAAPVAAPATASSRAMAAVAPTTHTPGEDILDTRRINLAILTSAPGAKGKMGEIMGLSPANISHRIHKHKKLDDVEALNFTMTLGLPEGWFDKPNTVKDIPAEVKKLLDPGPKLPRGTKKRMREEAAAQAAISGTPAKSAARKAPSTRKVAPADVQMPRLSGGVPTGKRPSAPAPAHAAVTAPALAAVGAPEPARSSPAPAPAPVRAAAPAPVATTPRVALAPARAAAAPMTMASAASTSLEDLGDIQPIARALLQTIALKARDGRIDEFKALELLQMVAPY